MRIITYIKGRVEQGNAKMESRSMPREREGKRKEIRLSNNKEGRTESMAVKRLEVATGGQRRASGNEQWQRGSNGGSAT